MLSLNHNVESHKYLEVIRGSDTEILLYSDDGSTIKKEVHTFKAVTSADAIGMLEKGMIIETVTNYTASGTWEQRYELDYIDDAASSTEEPVNDQAPEADNTQAGEEESIEPVEE